ncbi:MAG: RDD family protein [Actinomycetales bacterium]
MDSAWTHPPGPTSPYSATSYPANQPPAYPVAIGGQGYPGQPYPPGPPPGPITHLSDGMPLASVWKRLAASLLDSVFVSVVTLPIMWLLIALMMGGVIAAADGTSAGQEPSPAALIGAIFGLYAASFVLVGVVSYFYYILRVRQVGATFGKQLLGLRIRSVRADGQLTYGQIWARYGVIYLANLLTGGVLSLLDVLWCLWDPRRQCLHDKIAGTVVIDQSQPMLPPDHPQVRMAQALAISSGWVADGPVPVTPPGYPRHPDWGRYLR